MIPIILRGPGSISTSHIASITTMIFQSEIDLPLITKRGILGITNPGIRIYPKNQRSTRTIKMSTPILTLYKSKMRIG